MKNAWDRFWFRPGGPTNFIAARIIVAITSLWLVLSRPNLPGIVAWPEAFWLHPNTWLRARFLILGLPYAAELALYVVLIVALLLTAAGRYTAMSAFAAAVLLYHFAPFEDIFTSLSGPFFRGLTACVSCLFIISFAKQPRRLDQPSPEYRWPLMLMRLLFALTYLLSGISKLRLVGPRWATGQNFEGIVMAMMLPDATPPWAHWFIGHPLLCWLGALAGVMMDFLFIFTLFSPRAARILVPLVAVTHLVVVKVLGVVFPAAPLLLLFVNWEWLFDALRGRRDGSARAAERFDEPASAQSGMQ
ncbi:MAG: hypothetical protein JWO97_400 [Acidobacteria bacterium]|nr:hypothetical protein [Acidobacteriota bacterium]